MGLGLRRHTGHGERRGFTALAPGAATAGAGFVYGAAVIDGQTVSAPAWPDDPG